MCGSYEPLVEQIQTNTLNLSKTWNMFVEIQTLFSFCLFVTTTSIEIIPNIVTTTIGSRLISFTTKLYYHCFTTTFPNTHLNYSMVLLRIVFLMSEYFLDGGHFPCILSFYHHKHHYNSLLVKYNRPCYLHMTKDLE